MGLLDNNGDEVVRYTYNSWGKLETIDGSLKNTVGIKNSYRYRGYRYDTETGLYYVASRYYNPEIGRWINVDNQLSTGSDLTGMNLFAYCGSNPINRIDSTGEAWWHWAIGAGVVAACAIVVFATAGGAVAGIAAVAAVANGFATATTASTVAAAGFIASATYLGVSAMNAASNSKSVSDFNAQGNWGTVGGTLAAGVIGSGTAYVASKTSSVNSGSKSEKYIKSPQKIKNVPPTKIEKIAIKENLKIGTLSRGTHAGQGFKVNWGGDRLLQYHPGGGHHGPNSYWKVSAGHFTDGPIRIFNDK